MTIEGLFFFLLLRYLYCMKDIKTLIREGLNNYINEAEGKKTKEQEISGELPSEIDPSNTDF